LRTCLRCASELCGTVVGGDFNVTFDDGERNGRQGDLYASLDFQYVIRELKFTDMLMSGRRFTCCNRRAHPSMVKLDLSLCSLIKLTLIQVSCV